MPSSSQDFYNKILGASGEKRAVKYLKKQGFRILKTNYKTPFGEADIVATDGEDLVFVEVKTRTDDRFSRPAEAVDAAKQKRYRDIARYYLSAVDLDLYVRFDVVEVLGKEIALHKGAFRC